MRTISFALTVPWRVEMSSIPFRLIVACKVDRSSRFSR
jgi:hypothetical protein